MPLFNPKTLARALSEHQGEWTESQLAKARGWAEACASGRIKTTHETSLYSDFAQSILKEILGYKTIVDADEYTVAENERVGAGSVEFALGRFSTSTRRILAPFELKGASIDLDAIMPGRYTTPVQQAWDYATEAPGAEWVLVSN